METSLRFLPFTDDVHRRSEVAQTSIEAIRKLYYIERTRLRPPRSIDLFSHSSLNLDSILSPKPEE